MVLGSLVGHKVTLTVWVARVHQVKFSYTMEQFCKFHLVQVEATNATAGRCLPVGGYGKTWLYLVIESVNTLMPCTKPGHPARINVNLISKSQIASTFYVVLPLQNMCWIILWLGTTTGMWVPSSAPIQLLKKGWNLGFLNLGWIVLNSGSTSLMMSAASLTTLYKTFSKLLWTVPSDLSNLFSACLTDCGAPSI